MKSARNLIAILAALCLLGAQQAAFAHWAAHLGAPAGIALESPDDAHASAASLTQFCAGCAAFAGLDAALPSSWPQPEPETITELPAAFLPPSVTLIAARHFDSRAPPAFL